MLFKLLPYKVLTESVSLVGDGDLDGHLLEVGDVGVRLTSHARARTRGQIQQIQGSREAGIAATSNENAHWCGTRGDGTHFAGIS